MTRPTPQQLEWQRWQLGFFFHFGINTFADAEWSDGTFSPALFDPTDLDVDSWIEAAARWGAEYAILTAKHHDGFCLWPTTTTDYSVASSPWREGQGDMVADFRAACDRHGVRMGIYVSPWDRHAPEYADPTAYRDYYLTQLTELCTDYGELAEVWFDGAGSDGYVYDWAAIMEVVRTRQPSAMVFNMGQPTIRWVGNEDGLAAETVWYEASELAQSQYTEASATLPQTTYLPPECDVSVRPGWFWHAEEDPKSLEHLLAIHERSVGRGANLLLNVPPDRRGHLDPRDVERLDAWAAALAEDAATSVEAELTERTPGLWEANLPEPTSFNRLWLFEDLSDGQRVTQHRVWAEVNDTWRELASGTTMGAQRLQVCDPVVASRLRVEVDSGARLQRVVVQQSARQGWSELPAVRASTEEPESLGTV